MINEKLGCGWRPRVFIACYFGVIALATTFLWQPTADYWRIIDEAVFFLLNNTLDWGGGWTFVWGHLNTRFWDVSLAIIMGLPLVWILFFDRKTDLEQRFASVFVVILAVAIGIAIGKIGFRGVERISPSGVLTPFLNINQLLPGIKAKIGSGASFPGDHGVAALLYAITIIGIFRRPSLSMIAVFIAAINTMPRLIGGGHWLSDVIVGGLGIALAVVPFALAMPSVIYARKIIIPFLNNFLRPALNKIGLKHLLN